MEFGRRLRHRVAAGRSTAHGTAGRLLLALLVAATATAGCFALAGCSTDDTGGAASDGSAADGTAASSADTAPQAGLPDWADEDALTQQARSLIERYNARDYGAVAQACAALGVTEDDWAEASDPLLDQLGAFQGYGDVAFMHADDGTGTVYATVVQAATYENATMQFTVSYYEDGSVCGFYILQR